MHQLAVAAIEAPREAALVLEAMDSPNLGLAIGYQGMGAQFYSQSPAPNR
jgi:hypothetical protein